MLGKNDIIEFFEDNGLLARYYPGYEFRKSQLDMALAVFENLRDKTHIFIEAPTGIGKSFAYLVPAIYYAKETGKKALISTHTINLQEQLIHKDIPVLKEILPVDFKSALLKGKNNYLCPNRLAIALQKSNSLFETEERKTLEKIYKWASETSDGTISDLDFKIDHNVWSYVCAEHGICTSKTCGPVESTKCFFQKAKHLISEADVVVLNHHLFFTLFHLSMSEDSEGYLFHNDFVIFDEAHTLESVASEHISPSVSREAIKYQLNRLYNPKSKKGFLSTYPLLLNIIPDIVELNYNVNEFFRNIRDTLFSDYNSEKIAVRVFEKQIVNNTLKDGFLKLNNHLKELIRYSKSNLEENQLNDFIMRFAEFDLIIEDFLDLKNIENDFVYWVELYSKKPGANVSLCCSPVDISDFFRRYIFRENNSCILTSATLSINRNFDYFKNRLGGESANELKLPTQFDFENQVKIYIPKNVPPPQSENSREYIENLRDWIYYFIKKTGGKALVLFTNAYLLRTIKDEIDFLNDNNEFVLLVQEPGVSRKNLLDKFKSDINSVLFGLDSFWHGIDVPGESLSNLIITRLPFQVPDHPLIQAKLEYIERHGGNSFMQFSLPEAVFKFRQGVGRLIRNKSDTGIVTILDSRIVKKSYGKHFINSLDKCPVILIDEDYTEIRIF
jgi:ATP-dependent DNA helicase DinG